MSYVIYADGACKGNPGRGGWGAVVVDPQSKDVELSGSEKDSTNNRMELTGLIEGLKKVPEGATVTLYTDSQYCEKGITQWIHSWKKNNWRTKAKEPVKNKELWVVLDELVQKRKCSWQWVKGHNGHPGNERADKLASDAALRA